MNVSSFFTGYGIGAFGMTLGIMIYTLILRYKDKNNG